MDLRAGIGFGPNPGGPVAIAFQFVLRDEPHFTFLWQNSGGALKEGKGNGWDGTPEDGARLVTLMRNYRSPTCCSGRSRPGTTRTTRCATS